MTPRSSGQRCKKCNGDFGPICENTLECESVPGKNYLMKKKKKTDLDNPVRNLETLVIFPFIRIK